MGKSKNTGKEKITKIMELPGNVSAAVSRQFLQINGPKGDVKRELKQHKISIRVEGQKIIFESGRSTKTDKKIMGSLVAHVKNMIRGSQQHHSYTLKICSGHFPMNISIANSKLVVKNFIGEKVPRILQLKQGVDVKVEGDLIHVTSASKEIAGQVSADIEQLVRRPGYDTRIFQDGIYIINKDGKELK